MKRILKSILIVGIVTAFAVSVTGAFFSDTETSTGNILQAGELDLLIDNTSYYNRVLNPETTWSFEGPMKLFFDFHDLKPGDEGEDTISLHVQNDAYACMNILKTADDDVTCTGPEALDDGNCTEPGVGTGELGGLLEFMFWADDGDNVLEVGEHVFKIGKASEIFNGAVWTLADSVANIWNTAQAAGPIPANQDRFIGKAWCFGTLTENRVAEGLGISPAEDPGVLCDGSHLDNAAQTDQFMADINFSAVQARHNTSFRCVTDEVPACVPGYATGFDEIAQGTRKDGSAVLADRSDANDALGAPQSTGEVSDAPVIAGSFFSLGFGPENTPGGSIVLTFDDPIVDTPGHYDFRVFEVTGGVYPDEKIKVEASQDGVNWQTVTESVARDAFLDLGTTTLDWASRLRITDVSDKSLAGFPGDADGYDLDGVQTFCGTEPLPDIN